MTTSSPGVALATIPTLLAVVLVGLSGDRSTAQQLPATPALGTQATTATAFVANRGQWPAPTVFRMHRTGASASLDPGGMSLQLRQPDYGEPMPSTEPSPNPGLPVIRGYRTATPRLEFVGAVPTGPRGELERTARASFLLGREPTAWRTGVPTFGDVRWSQPWPGIDVVAHVHAIGLIEYDLVVAAGVDPRQAMLRWDGATAVEQLPDGTLQLTTSAGPLLQSAPKAWQLRSDGAVLPVAVRVDLAANGRFCFVPTSAVDPELPLTIDPVITYLGGSANEHGFGVARDATGRVYVAGFTDSPPTAGLRDVFVSCFDFRQPPASQWQWTTCIGGSLDDVAFDVDVDLAGFVTLTGYTQSANFPLQNPLQPAFGGGLLDGFVTRLDPTGTVMLFSTYLGGNGDDWSCRVEVDGQLQSTVAGYTFSTNFQVTANALQPGLAGASDVFVTRLPPVGGAPLLYSTYVGGSSNEGFLWTNWSGYPVNIRELGLDVDRAGRVLVAGMTWSHNGFPVPYPTTPGALQPVHRRQWDGFATILDPGASTQLVWSTFLGGTSTSDSEAIMAARFGPNGTVVVGGNTYSASFWTTPGAFRTTPASAPAFTDAFLSWLDPSAIGAAQLVYSTYLGSSGNPSGGDYDSVLALAVDGRGHATVSGSCSGGFPAERSAGRQMPARCNRCPEAGRKVGCARIRPAFRGRQDLTYGTYLGGAQAEAIADVEIEPEGGVAIAGQTGSAGIPGVLGTLSGTYDALAGTIEMLPTRVARGAGNSPYCFGTANEGTLLFEVDRQPAAGAPFELLVGGAPPNTVGMFGLNFGPPAVPNTVPLPGAALAVALVPSPVIAFRSAGVAGPPVRP